MQSPVQNLELVTASELAGIEPELSKLVKIYVGGTECISHASSLQPRREQHNNGALRHDNTHRQCRAEHDATRADHHADRGANSLHVANDTPVRAPRPARLRLLVPFIPVLVLCLARLAVRRPPPHHVRANTRAAYMLLRRNMSPRHRAPRGFASSRRPVRGLRCDINYQNAN